jgi:hypothetical protein
MRLKGESSRFTLVVFLAFLLVIAGVVATSLVFTIRAINHNAEDSVAYLQDFILEEMEGKLRSFSIMLRDPVIENFFTEGSGGDDYQMAITLKSMLQFSFEDPLYVALISGEDVVISTFPRERGEGVPSDLIAAGSEILDSFRGSSGNLVMVTSALSSEINATVVKDITTELEEAQEPFDEQKSQAKWTALILFLAFLAFTLFIVLLVILPAQRRYITGPIDKLSDAARRIMGEDTDVQVEVDEDSDFYYLQALLDSTKRLIERSFQTVDEKKKEDKE